MRLAAAMAAGEATPPGPQPPNQLAQQWSLVPPVVADGVPAGKRFGDVAEDVAAGSYGPGDTVAAVFHAGCPRNNIRAEGTFLTGAPGGSVPGPAGCQAGSEGWPAITGGGGVGLRCRTCCAARLHPWLAKPRANPFPACPAA